MRLFHKHDCATEGHVWRTEKRSIWRQANHFRCMAHLSDQERLCCRHCRHSEDWREVHGECFQSYSWPASMADEFRRQGWVRR